MNLVEKFGSFIVTLVNKGGDHLKAVSNDGDNGTANCQFPKEWNGISRNDFSNAGRKFEVNRLEWNGKFYRVNSKDIVKEITEPTTNSTVKSEQPKVEPAKSEPTTQKAEKEPEKHKFDITKFKKKSAENVDDDISDYFKG